MGQFRWAEASPADERLSGERRRRHLAADANALRGEVDEMSRENTAIRDNAQDETCQPRTPIKALRKQLQIGPGIEVVLLRQQEHFGSETPRREFDAIRILIPANPVQQRPILRAEGDQVTPAAMIRPQDEAPVAQLHKRLCDIASGQLGTIAPDDDDLFIAKGAQRLDRILETFAESAAGLGVKMRVGQSRMRAKDVEIDAGSVAAPHGPSLEKRSRGARQMTAGAVGLRLLSEEKESTSREMLRERVAVPAPFDAHGAASESRAHGSR